MEFNYDHIKENDKQFEVMGKQLKELLDAIKEDFDNIKAIDEVSELYDVIVEQLKKICDLG